MSVPSVPEQAMLVISVLTAVEGNLTLVEQAAEEQFGPLCEKIGPLAFGFTAYYDKELGSGIRRWVWAFDTLIDRNRLAGVKLATNNLESRFSIDGKRRFNLDPGLLTLGNFVLATGKNNAHRIYLDRGIFADLTLIYRAKTYNPLEWTYPDWADSELLNVLNTLRESYKCKLADTATRR